MGNTLSKHRIEGLTDGIFAIVMTLLVLELKVPELERHAANQEILAKLTALGPQLFAFFLTFVLAGVFWFQHHISMHFIRHMTRPLLLVNLIFLMFVSLLPFSAAMLGRFLSAPIALEIYYGHQLLLGILLGLQWEIVRRNDLIAETATPGERRRLPLRLWRLPLACLAALIVAFVRPAWSQGAFAIFAVIGRVISRQREQKVSADPVLVSTRPLPD